MENIIEMEGIVFNVNFTEHSQIRALERGIEVVSIFELIEDMLDEVLDLTLSEMQCFALKDEKSGETAICRMDYLDGIFYIDIITLYINRRNQMNRRQISKVLKYKSA